MALILLWIYIRRKKKECKKNYKIIYIFSLNYLFGFIKFIIFITNFIVFSIFELSMRLICIHNIIPFLYDFIISIYYGFSLMLLGVYTTPYKYKKHSKNVNPNIVISSQSSIIDWLILAKNYSPKFLYIAKSKNNASDAFFELSFFTAFFYGIGIKFPKNNSNDTNKYFNLKNYLDKNKQSKPLVIFPEATKSNRLAVLRVRSNLMDEIYDNAIKRRNNFKIRSEIIMNKKHDINTTDTFGIKSLFSLCCNFYTPVEIYSQDIDSGNFIEENLEYDKEKYPNFNLYLDSVIQENLMELNHRNCVFLNSFDHEKFIDYYKKTSSDSKANYVKRNF